MERSILVKGYECKYVKSVSGGYVGYACHVHGAMSQGNTIDELKNNLEDAINLINAFNKRTHSLTG